MHPMLYKITSKYKIDFLGKQATHSWLYCQSNSSDSILNISMVEHHDIY